MAGCGGRWAATKMYPYIVFLGINWAGPAFSTRIGGALEMTPPAFLLNSTTVGHFPHRHLLLSPPSSENHMKFVRAPDYRGSSRTRGAPERAFLSSPQIGQLSTMFHARGSRARSAGTEFQKPKRRRLGLPKRHEVQRRGQIHRIRR